MMNGMFGGGMWFNWLFWIILIIVVIWAIVQYGNRNRMTDITNNAERETPLDILKKRYAKGEITKEEFDKMKKDLY